MLCRMLRREILESCSSDGYLRGVYQRGEIEMRRCTFISRVNKLYMHVVNVVIHFALCFYI